MIILNGQSVDEDDSGIGSGRGTQGATKMSCDEVSITVEISKVEKFTGFPETSRAKKKKKGTNPRIP